MCSSISGEVSIFKMLTPQNHEASGESRMDKMRKFLSSPLSRKKPSSSQYKIFGTSLETLMQRSPSEHSVPFILTRICEYIEKTGMAHEGLFRISGNARSIERLKIAFDRSGDAPLETDGDVPSAAALLKLFLRELPDPIIPMSMHREFLNAVKEKSKEESLSLLMKLVQKLPSTNYCVLNYLSCFLKQVSEMEEQNRMSASSLGIVFGPNLFRVTEDFVGLKEQSLTNQIVTFFITDYDIIFKHDTDHFSKKDHDCPAVSMVSSWPKSKALTQSMLSTWSLQPLSVSIPSVDDTFLPLASLAHSMGSEQANALLVSSTPEKSESSHSSLHLHGLYTEEQASTYEMTISADQMQCTKDASTVSNYLEQSFYTNEDIDYSSSCNPSFQINSLHEPEAEGDCLSFKSKQDVSLMHDDQRPVQDSGRKKSNSHSLSSQEENFSANKSLEDIHKNYHRGHRRHIHRHKKRHVKDDGMKSAQTYSDCSVDSDEKEEFLTVEDGHDGNANHVAKLSYNKDFVEDTPGAFGETNSDTRHSWPAVRKFQHEEDIALSPLPQQLRVATSVEAPLSPSAFRSYLSHRNLHLDPSLPPSPPVEQEDLITGKTKDDTKATARQLSRTIHSLKKKIKQFEDNFEKLYGYKPSHAEKYSNAVIKKAISDLNKARQELKESKDQSSSWISDISDDFPPSQNKISKGTNTRIGKSSLKAMSRDSESTSFEESVRNATECLMKQQQEAQRPEILEEMTKEQLVAEKLAIQKILLNFESFHGRPCSKLHRDLMRPLYDRYRCVKRLMTRSAPNTLAKESADLVPIIEHEAMDFTSLEKDQETKSETVTGMSHKENPSLDVKNEPLKDERNLTKSQLLLHRNYHELSLSELLEEQRLAQDEKRQLRRVLRDFEDRFKQENGRKVQREDKRAMESEYSEYKNAKAKLKLLEALVSKHEPSSVP